MIDRSDTRGDRTENFESRIEPIRERTIRIGYESGFVRFGSELPR